MVFKMIKRNVMALTLPAILILVAIGFLLYKRQKVVRAVKNAANTLSEPVPMTDPKAGSGNGSALANAMNGIKTRVSGGVNSIEGYYARIRKSL